MSRRSSARTSDYRVPLLEHLRREAGTMAVDLILRDGRADLIAMRREILGSPSRPMGAALKLGNKGPFCWVSPPFASAWNPSEARIWNQALDLKRSALNCLEKFVIFWSWPDQSLILTYF